ncbi:D-alanyl-D-alanine carboxypeptidase family protein [Aurantimonas sp. A2-1-M11]|uniref:D-alanyl-D-alanine carboxypeptidase family protein n=1 Tax=Aurantimonas sp. A2-1-M11 TaxID=3113712 RepID=UPI002F946F3E
MSALVWRRVCRGFVLCCFAALLQLGAPATGPAAAFETSAPTAILVDHGTGRVLYEKSADEEIAPASLAKLMTIIVLFEDLKQGRVQRDDRFTVSEYAWRTGGASSGGSTMFLPLNSDVSVDDLIRGIIVQSGNDATIVVAEGLSGSVEAFAKRMNEEAETIGLTHSHFTNPHGLPDPEQHVSVRDLARLAAHLIREFPEDYPIFAEESFAYNGINQRNRNPLLALGADGLKTGHTSDAGYGLVASAQRDGRRIVLAMSGMDSAAERASEARRLMNFGLQDFEEVVLVTAGETLGTAAVRGGVVDRVDMAAAEDLRMLVPRGSLSDVEREVVENGPFVAPVSEGQRLGWVRFARGDETLRQVPLLSETAVEEAGLFQRIAETLARNLGWGGAQTP